MQELLDRLSRCGLIIYPYFVVAEPAPTETSPVLEPPYTLRRLTVDDAAEMVRVSVANADLNTYSSQLKTSLCVGLFYEGQLAAYTWASLVRVPVPGSGGRLLFPLRDDEAYLFNMYVTPSHRGARLAGVLRSAMQLELLRERRSRFFSITLAFNRSSRRFKARLGAVELELRLYLHFVPRRLPGVDLRLWRQARELRSPRLKRIEAAPGVKTGE
jgi:hypothetical protein